MTWSGDKDDFRRMCRLSTAHTYRIGEYVKFYEEQEKEEPCQREITRLCVAARGRHVSTTSVNGGDQQEIARTHLPDVVVAVVFEGHGDRVHQHVAQYNEVAYHELLDSAGHDQDGKADQPELPPQYQQLPPHECRFVVTAHVHV